MFGTMEKLVSGRGMIHIGEVINNITATLVIKQLNVYQLHLQANGTIERWNRTLTSDIESVMGTG